ncbi:MAG: hypothetical protein MR270_01150 [Erysipelotrichaceae bacterium]|nr:hypothetical protein [Erysipelotrichaceae bacterium]
MTKKRFFLFLLVFILLFSLINSSKTINALATSNENETTFIHSSGRHSSLLLSSNNIVYGWGLWGESNDVALSKKLVSPTDLSKDIKLSDDDYFINVFSGEQHSFFLTNSGRVFAIGSGEKGQLGYSDYIFKSNPVEITQMFLLQGNEKITYIACGDDFNIALTNFHKVISFGKNEDGQLGVPANEKKSLTYDITSLFSFNDDDYLIDVKCGASHSLALSKNGFVYVWGLNTSGQLGIKDEILLDTPTRLDIKHSACQIAVGRYTSYVLTNMGQLYGFGSDSYGQLATHDALLSSNSKKSPYLMNANFPLESDESIKQIIAGYYFAFIKTNLGNYYGFGQNSAGQLANNTTISTSVPVKIEYKSILDPLDEINDISCGIDHCIATTKFNHILAWGSNIYGQLSENLQEARSYYVIHDITYNFPPIIIISTLSSSVEYKNYILNVDAYYLDNETIDETYYSVSSSSSVPKDKWTSFNKEIILSEYEGTIYVHIKVVSKKETYYHVSKAFFLDHITPSIVVLDENNQEILSPYYNSTIFVKAMDNNDNVDIVYTYNGNQYTTNEDTISFSLDGTYQFYAQDGASNTSATIELTIDTFLPTITKIDNNIISGTSYSTREKEITIQGSEALSCYNLGYKGVKADFYSALNDNETTFKVKLKKGVNTLTIFDLAGNESMTYEILYTPRFFQDTQLLLIVFSSISAIFVIIIIVTYTIKNKKKLIK